MQKYRYGMDVFDCRRGNCPGWKRMETIHGICCVFNYHPGAKQNASVLNQAGKLGGMNILFSGKNAASEGVTLIITRPGSFVTHLADLFTLVPGFDNYFRLYLTHDIYTSYYEKLSVKLRRCFTAADGEKSLVFQTRCLLVCAAKKLHEICNCHPYFLPILEPEDKSFRSCTVADLMCVRYRAGK